MMFLVPFLIALIPGVIIFLVTWTLAKKGYALSVRMLPGILLITFSLVVFYIGFVHIRGFEGALYGILSFFLIMFALISMVIGKKIIT
jgi:hypothetical protein